MSDSDTEEEVVVQGVNGFHEDATLHLQLCGTDLMNVEGFFGCSDPYVRIASYTGLPGPSMWQPMFRSEHIPNSLTPKWKPIELNLDLLCKRDLDQPIQISVMDYEENGRDNPMGSFQTTVNGLLEAKVYLTDGERMDTSKGFTVMQDFLSRFPKIDAVWAQDDDIAIGVIQAVRQARRQDELFVVGGGGMKDIVKRVMDGDELTPVDVLYPPSMISTAMELTALKLISNTPIEGEYILGSPLITQDNAEDYYFPDSPF